MNNIYKIEIMGEVDITPFVAKLEVIEDCSSLFCIGNIIVKDKTTQPFKSLYITKPFFINITYILDSKVYKKIKYYSRLIPTNNNANSLNFLIIDFDYLAGLDKYSFGHLKSNTVTVLKNILTENFKTKKDITDLVHGEEIGQKNYNYSNIYDIIGYWLEKEIINSIKYFSTLFKYKSIDGIDKAVSYGTFIENEKSDEPNPFVFKGFSIVDNTDLDEDLMYLNNYFSDFYTINYKKINSRKELNMRPAISFNVGNIDFGLECGFFITVGIKNKSELQGVLDPVFSGVYCVKKIRRVFERNNNLTTIQGTRVA